MINVHMFWAYGDLRKLENLCLRSFLRNGYEVNLWSYNTKCANVPKGVILRDARGVLSETSVFVNARRSYAGFSDLFRYALLRKHGGLYVDTDVIALVPANTLPTEPFLVSEFKKQNVGRRTIMKMVNWLFDNSDLPTLNGNVIYNPLPESGDLIDLAYAYAEAFPKEKLMWSEIGPSLLSAFVTIFPQHGFKIMPAIFGNPVGFWRCPQFLLTPGKKLPEGAAFLHCYNEMWRLAGVDVNAPYPADSIMDSLERRYWRD